MHFVQRQRRVRHQQLILVFGIKVQLVSYTYFVSSCPAAAIVIGLLVLGQIVVKLLVGLLVQLPVVLLLLIVVMTDHCQGTACLDAAHPAAAC